MRIKRMLALLTAMLLPTAAFCEPYVSNGTHTAWLGENDWLYLLDGEGGLKYMRTAMQDLPAMDDTSLYCLTSSGSLWAVRLDGSASSIIAQGADQAAIDSVKPAPGWHLEGDVLTLNAGAQITGVLAACSCGGTLYFVSQTGVASPVLQTRPLDGSLPSLLQPGVFVGTPLSLSASPSHVTVLTDRGALQVISLLDWSIKEYTAPEGCTAAYAVNGQLYCYSKDLSGSWHLAGSLPLDGGASNVVVPNASSTPYVVRPTATARPTATPRPTARPTARPTSTPRVTSRPTAAPEDNVIRRGDRGTAVKKLQRRLAALGYPVGSVDGRFGEATEYALNLFQFAAGLKEVNYASAKCQEKLNSKKAPYYDPYLPLVKGDAGTPVVLMQEALKAWGFNPGKIDGKFGSNTIIALEAFQKHVGLPVDGTFATAECLMVLYNNSPVTPGDLNG